MTKLLDSLTLPQDLRKLDVEQLRAVCSELRDELIETVASAGGHFASSLGATEITVALHHVFDAPNDKLVWDVGHQGYVHKMVTGRREKLATIRKRNGISGFLRRDESSYDAFGAGHAGTSISAAVGMAVAMQHTTPGNHAVAIIGDGSLTSGMAFEAMNHAGHLGLNNLIVVLNDNEMSISPNVGAISWLFSRAVTSKTSTTARTRFKNWYRNGYVPELVYKAIDRAEEVTKGFFAGAAMLFEGFGFRYIGPVDGHNVEDLVAALTNAKQQDVPVLIHAYTTKGKGYEPAEEDPIKWHGVTPFERTKGEFLTAVKPLAVKEPPSYTSVFANTTIDLMKSDPKVVAITAAMLGGTGLDKVQAVLPERVFDVGICEQHAVTFAAGLACEGIKPICAIYSTFLQRAYDQVVHDVCIQNMPVVFAMDRGGVVGNDGETHQGVFDIAFLRTLPNIVLMSPKDENELRHMLFSALEYRMPVALRYPRGNGMGAAMDAQLQLLPLGRSEVVLRGSTVLLLCFGPIVQYGMIVAESLAVQHGVTCTVVNMRFAKPLDTEMLQREVPNHALVCTLEDHALMGGLGSAVLEELDSLAITPAHPLLRFGVRDQYVTHASQSEQHQMQGYDPQSIIARVEAALRDAGLIDTLVKRKVVGLAAVR